MKQPLWLLAPLRANRMVSPWVAVAVMLLTGGVAVGIGLWSNKSDAWVGSVMMIALGLGAVWAFVMSNTALLAIDARQLRLPGVSRATVVSLWLYGVGSVVVPTCLLSLFVGHLISVTLIMALACSVGLMVALLPRVIAMSLFFVPMLLQTFSLPIDVPGPGDTGFVMWALATLVGVILLASLCWRRLVRSRAPYAQSFAKPLVLQFRGSACGGGGWSRFGRGVDNTLQIQSHPDWMQPQPNLHGCGPGQPRRSLRVAMGSPFMPLTAMGWIRQLGVVLLPGAVIALLLIARSLQRNHAPILQLLWRKDDALLLIWISVLASLLMALICLLRVGQLWTKTNAELPLLALMPGLGNGGRNIKQNLLAALIWPALRIPLVLLVATLLLAAAIGLSLQTVEFILLGQLGSVGLVIAFVLSTIGGRPLPAWLTTIFGIFGCILINVSLLVPTLSDPATLSLGFFTLAHGLLVAWTTLALALIWLARRGWHGLQQRPHPFLPN